MGLIIIITHSFTPQSPLTHAVRNQTGLYGSKTWMPFASVVCAVLIISNWSVLVFWLWVVVVLITVWSYAVYHCGVCDLASRARSCGCRGHTHPLYGNLASCIAYFDHLQTVNQCG